MIVATAGHIDHGKTALVRALTGVDTDRLPEEKRRGLSIELGFAYRRTTSGGSLGFVDVPGHERFVRHMVAGVSAVDFALIVVAADDGPMPQTREHLAILNFLAIPQGAVALTKADRVSDARLREVAAAVAGLVGDAGFAGAPIFPVASPSGRGVPELLSHLESCAEAHAPRAATGAFRLAIDRRFSLAGAGLIVAGAVVAGSASTGDRLVVAPGGTPVRIRSLHVNGVPAVRALAGERCACNVAAIGQRRMEISRGDWLVAEEAALATRRIDARVRLQADVPRPLRDARIHMHLGAAEASGRLAAIEGSAIQPGGEALAQILLDREVGAWWGDRFVLRDSAGQRTIGGGRVLDPEAPGRGRRAPARLAQLAAQQEASPARALSTLAALCPGGVPLAPFRRGRALSADEWSGVEAEVSMVRFGPPAAERAIRPEQFQASRDRLLRAVADCHARDPEAVGPTGDELIRGLVSAAARPVFQAALTGLLREGALVREGAYLRLPTWRPALSPADSRLWKRIEPLLDVGGLRPPRFRELAAKLDAPLALVESIVRRAARLGLAVPVASNRAFSLAAIRQLAAIAEALAEAAPEGDFSASEFRDRSGVGRNLTIEVLEYFDHIGLTRRVGSARRLVRTADQVFATVPVAAEGAAA